MHFYFPMFHVWRCHKFLQISPFYFDHGNNCLQNFFELWHHLNFPPSHKACDIFLPLSVEELSAVAIDKILVHWQMHCILFPKIGIIFGDIGKKTEISTKRTGKYNLHCN